MVGLSTGCGWCGGLSTCCPQGVGGVVHRFSTGCPGVVHRGLVTVCVVGHAGQARVEVGGLSSRGGEVGAECGVLAAQGLSLDHEHGEVA